MEGPLPAGRELVGVRARLIQRRDANRLARAIERNPVEVVLGGVIGRRHEVDLTGFFIDMNHADHVNVAGGRAAAADDFHASERPRGAASRRGRPSR